MSWLKTALARLRGMFHRSTTESELDRELRTHLEMLTEDGVRRGLSPLEAQRQARLALGNPAAIREAFREQAGIPWLEAVWQDARYGLRMMRRSPGFTAVAVLSLALGIGANTAIFSVLDALMLKTLPVASPGELVQIGRQLPGDRFNDGFTYALWRGIHSTEGIFVDSLAYGSADFDLASGGEKRAVAGLWVSGDYFKMLGVPAIVGRTLTAADDVRGAAPAAVISYGFWKRQYGGDPNVAGRILRLDGHPFEVVGVTPPEFFGLEVGSRFDVAVPVASEPIFHAKDPWLDRPWTWWLRVAGRLKPGIDAQQATARLQASSHGVFSTAMPPANAEEREWVQVQTLAAEPLANGYSDVRTRYGQALVLLMAMVGVVLLIACANIANLLLARSSTRRREIAVRLALGAGRMRLVRQLLTESALLAALGAAAGTVLATWGSELLVKGISTGREPHFLDLSLDARTLGFTAAATLVTALLFGLVPALRSAHLAPYAALKDGGRALGERPGRWALGRVLVSAQVALSLLLLVGAGLFVRSLEKLLNQDPGFQREGVLLVKPDLRGMENAVAREDAVRAQLIARLREMPGVRFAARSSDYPIEGGSSQWDVMVQAPGMPLRRVHVYGNKITRDYFQALGTPLLAGRDFTDEDTRGAPQVAIINESAARQFFPGANPVGQTLLDENSWDEARNWIPVQIIGVVKDARYRELRQDIPPTLYRPVAQVHAPYEPWTYELRFAGPVGDLTARVKQAAREVDPRIGLEFQLFATRVEESLLRERLLALLASGFGGLALLLAAVGIYGLMSYTTTRRTNEIGVRMALGARPGDVVRMVVDEALVLILGGVAVGVPAALLATRLLDTMLFGIQSGDPLTFVGATALMAAGGVAAVLVPARRAARVDPMVALRYE